MLPRLPSCRFLAGQLLYGDSLQCSNFELDIETGLNVRPDCGHGVDEHFAIALPNRTTLPATREAGLVQIANALVEDGLVPKMTASR